MRIATAFLITLAAFNAINADDLPTGVVPLAYVARMKNRDSTRSRLRDERIFCPVHWRLPDEVSPRRFPDAAKLAATCLSLPIDQRYGAGDMDRIALALGNKR